MLFLINFGVIFIGFGIEPPLIYWTISTLFAIFIFVLDYIKYNHKGILVNLFNGNIFIFFFVFILSQCFVNFSLPLVFWTYFMIIASFEMVVNLINRDYILNQQGNNFE